MSDLSGNLEGVCPSSLLVFVAAADDGGPRLFVGICKGLRPNPYIPFPKKSYFSPIEDGD